MVKIYMIFFVCILIYCGTNGENMIENGSFEKKLENWKIVSIPKNDKLNWSEIDVCDGKNTLKITKASEAENMMLESKSCFNLNPQRSYYFRMKYKTGKINPNLQNVICIRLAIFDADGKPLTKNYKWIKLSPVSNFILYELKNKEFITDSKARKGSITVFFLEKGEYWIDDITLEEEPLTCDDKSFVQNGKRFFYMPRDKEKDLPMMDIHNNESHYDYIIYRRNPRMMYPDSIPQMGEKISEIKQFSVPGEYCVFYFSIYAIKELDIVNIKLDNFSDKLGNKLIIDSWKIKDVKFWKQSANIHQPYYYIIPELLEDFRPISLSSSENKLFWIQFRVPENQKPGIYKGNIVISLKSGKEETLSVYLRICPFRLKKPDAVWLLEPSFYACKNYTYEQKLRYFKNISDYGINNIIIRTLPSFNIVNGKVENLKFNQIAELLNLQREAGMSGPWGNFVQQVLECEIINKMTKKNIKTDIYPLSENEDPVVQNAFVYILEAMNKTIKSLGGSECGDWYYQCIDEPHQGTRLKQALWELKLAKKAGIKTFASAYFPETIETLGKYLDVSWNSLVADSEEKLNSYLKLGEKFNLTYWFLGAGCYTGQEGGLMPNRYLAGFLFFKTNLPCHVSWVFQWVKDDPFNDFDGQNYIEAKDLCLTYPSKNKKEAFISTLQWEGIREGITDYKYAFTLREYIKEAKRRGFIKEASYAQSTLDKVLSYVPWRSDYQGGDYYMSSGNFTNDKADKLRWILANEIIKLKEVLNGQ